MMRPDMDAERAEGVAEIERAWGVADGDSAGRQIFLGFMSNNFDPQPGIGEPVVFSWPSLITILQQCHQIQKLAMRSFLSERGN